MKEIYKYYFSVLALVCLVVLAFLGAAMEWAKVVGISLSLAVAAYAAVDAYKPILIEYGLRKRSPDEIRSALSSRIEERNENIGMFRFMLVCSLGLAFIFVAG